VDHAAARPSCPRCGADCPPETAHCKACGFALIVDAERRRPRSPSSGLPRLAALAAAVASAAAVLVVLLGGGRPGDSAVTPALAGPPAPVPALEAERRLELRFAGERDDESTAVRCPYRIEPRQLVRCELRYPDGIARAMLVRLTRSGELDAAIPYPATLRR
jgi:hypothetical protein